MTAFVLSADTNIDALAGKAGGDSYDTNGFKLTIDQDSRVGLNQTTSTTLGSMTLNAAKGGEIHVDGTGVWLIPYTGGAGNVPAWNTVIGNGSGSGKLIGVHPALTAASLATGAALPAAGYLRVKQKTGAFQAGALAGISATAANEGTTGWLDIVGDEASTVNANRLGTFRATGAWFRIGTTSGASNQTMQIPNNGLPRYCAGVFIEKAVGAGEYEFWPNAGTATTIGTEAARGKVVWIDNTGLVRLGHSGVATAGHTPAAGLDVVVPNLFFEICTTADRMNNVIPHATLGTRYDFTCAGGGVLEIDKCNMAWYLSAVQAYSLHVSHSGFVDAIMLSNVAAPVTFSKVGVGNKPGTALAVSPLTMSYCFAGGTFTDCVWTRVSMDFSGAHTNTLADIADFTFVRDTVRANTIRGNATTYSINATRALNCAWIDPVIIQGAMNFSTCRNIAVTGTVYCEAVSGTTPTTYSGFVWIATAGSINCVFSGLTLPVTNTPPYTALMYVSYASANIKLRNIGTRAAPLSLGSVNACGLIYQISGGAQDVKVQRVYCSNTRTGLMSGDNSCTRITEENVFGDYADAVDVMACLNMRRKGMGGTGALTAQISVYGTHWRDGFTSATSGRIALLMNEPTVATAGLVSLSPGAKFTSSGILYMPAVGMSATFEMPDYVIGHTGFQNAALVMAGGTAANFAYEYAIDTNDGNGFSSMSSSACSPAALGTALSQITGIDAGRGFKLKLKITTVNPATPSITSVYVLTSSSAAAQDYQYPLDTNAVTFTHVPEMTEIRIRQGSFTLAQQQAVSGGRYTFFYEPTGTTVRVQFTRPGIVFEDMTLTLSNADQTLPVTWAPDPSYSAS